MVILGVILIFTAIAASVFAVVGGLIWILGNRSPSPKLVITTATPAAAIAPPPPKTAAIPDAPSKSIPWKKILKIFAWVVVGVVIIGILLWAIPRFLKYFGGSEWDWTSSWSPTWLTESAAIAWREIPGLLEHPMTWLLISIVLLRIAFTQGSMVKWIAILFLLILVFGFGLRECTEKALNRVDRALNHGDWSAPSDYVPRVDGGTFAVPAGSIQTVDISGRVRIPIPAHHCLDIKGNFWVSWDDAISNAFITPKSGGVERGTIEALPAERCGKKI